MRLPERLGLLDRGDPLYELLIDIAASDSPVGGDFDVLQLNGPEGAVYLYLHDTTGFRAVGKFYGRKVLSESRPDDTDLRSVLLRREHDNLIMLRGLGFNGERFSVPRPIAAVDAIDWVLVEEYAEGANLHHAIWDLIHRGEDRPLRDRLTMAAEFLALLHHLPVQSGILPFRDPFAYLRRVVSQLQEGSIIDDATAARLHEIGERWQDLGLLANPASVMIHGDSTPEHFVARDGEHRLTVIDLETLRIGEPAEDLGYLTGEMKHLFWSYTDNPWSSEPYIRHFYAAYAEAAAASSETMADLTSRARYFMACAELRIARNNWPPLEYRRRLVWEAEQCLMV